MKTEIIFIQFQLLTFQIPLCSHFFPFPLLLTEVNSTR